MAQPVSNQPVPNKVSVASTTPTPTQGGPEIKVGSSEPREKIPSGSHSSEVNTNPEPVQASNPQWRSDGDQPVRDASDTSNTEEEPIKEKPAPGGNSSKAGNVDENEQAKVRPQKGTIRQQRQESKYAHAIREEIAAKGKKIELNAQLGMEHVLIAELIKNKRWQEVKLIVSEEGVLPGLLINLQNALSAAGEKKQVYIKIAMDGLSKPFALPSSPALQLTGLHVDLLMDCERLAQLLEHENTRLTEVIWSSADEPDSQVESLLKGSHQLCKLELSPLPTKVDELLQALTLKPKLETLSLGKGKYGSAGNGKLLAQILNHAPTLKRLTLDRPTFKDSSLGGCSAAFQKSGLIEFNLHAPKLVNGLENKTCELLDGVSKATQLTTLGLRNYGESKLDEPLLKAFARNPAASTLNVFGMHYDASLDSLLIAINKDRAGQKWGPISLKCPENALPKAYTFTYDSGSDSD